MLSTGKILQFPMQKAENHAHISFFPSPNLPFEREFRENVRTYSIVIQNSLCLPALRHITRFADAKSR